MPDGGGSRGWRVSLEGSSQPTWGTDNPSPVESCRSRHQEESNRAQGRACVRVRVTEGLSTKLWCGKAQEEARGVGGRLLGQGWAPPPGHNLVCPTGHLHCVLQGAIRRHWGGIGALRQNKTE